ncbi:hypothetical protein ANN_12365, partial [Periplaneta americana]
MYSNQELAEIHFMYGKADGNAALARRLYQESYPQRQCPDRKTFVRLNYRLCEYGKFNSPGLGRGRPRSTTPEVQEEILETVNMTPPISTRRVALQVNVPHTTVWRLLKEYQLYPYHLQRVQALSPADYPARVRFCQWFLLQCGVNPNLFTDEAQFTRDGITNFHNQHAYTNFLENTIPHVLEDTPLINRQHIHFLHDGAPAHFSRTARRYLERRFPDRWIGRGGPIAWPPRSPDLNPLDFYLWGHLKSLVYSSPVPDLKSLRNRIEACSEDIRNTPGVWDRVRRSMRHRCSIAYICQPLGAVSSGVLTDLMGRKRVMLLINLPFLLGWVLMATASSFAMLCIAHVLMGITAGLIEAPLTTYIGEVCQPSIRGVMSCMSSVMYQLGSLLVLLTGTLTDWRTTAVICTSIPVVTAVCLLLKRAKTAQLLQRDEQKQVGKSGCDVGKRTVPVRKYDSILKALSSLENANIFLERTILSNSVLLTICGLLSLWSWNFISRRGGSEVHSKTQVPEAPIWLISKGRIKDAEKALCWLRGWEHGRAVLQELSEMVSYHDSRGISSMVRCTQQYGAQANHHNPEFARVQRTAEPSAFVNPSFVDDNNESVTETIVRVDSDARSGLIQRAKEMGRPPTRRPFLLIVAFMFFTAWSGYVAVRPFMIHVFTEFQMPVSAGWAT